MKIDIENAYPQNRYTHIHSYIPDDLCHNMKKRKTLDQASLMCDDLNLARYAMKSQS